jgi:putative transposase
MCGKACLSEDVSPKCPEAMPPISADSPLYFLTSVTHHRLPIFAKDSLKQILATAFNEARTSGSFKIFGYGIMPDHYHIVTDNGRKPSDVLRFLNGISARRIINYLKENNFETSLNKLRKQQPGKNDYQYSVWEHHSNTFLITSEATLLQKIKYIHQNPVADGLVEDGVEYRFSSIRYWQRKPLLDEEPLEPDLKDL